MTKGYPISEWSPDIPITEKDDETQNEGDEITSTNGNKIDDDIT